MALSTACSRYFVSLSPETVERVVTVTVAGLDFTGMQTADPGDDLLAAHIHAPAPRGANAGVRFGFFGMPFNDTNPTDTVVTPFPSGVGGTVFSKWDLAEGNNTHPHRPVAEYPCWSIVHQLPHAPAEAAVRSVGQIEENPQVTANVHKVFSYGHRNSFGFDFDPRTGNLWLEENGDDTFTELNLVQPGMNGGWIQVIGPLARIDQFKEIETTMFGGDLQQSRWPPTNIADSPDEALARMVELPGAHYSDPEFSWKFEVAPAGIGFMNGRGLGPRVQRRPLRQCAGDHRDRAQNKTGHRLHCAGAAPGSDNRGRA